ncbi:A-kinase anchor protein 10, mitochondrial [Anopheles maculipalpis]|uniref:A-kinase anchor protein 10, mitochondrial n=1 Tax=Anopheles maculipalpis TaxID=1496333 RepID=UPI0021593094|nr:A-kinase anchor protein 10, mitochondrial [Anopheles maculipalpis]
MLQFLKKTGRRKSITTGSNSEYSPSSILNNDPTTDPSSLRTSDDVIDGTKAPENDEEALRQAERYCFERKDTVSVRVSKLSRRMIDILAEQSCICYFVQFLESKNALSLIKFWLEVESFKAAASESVRGGVLRSSVGGSGGHAHGRLHRSVSSDGYDSLSYFSIDCDSLSTNSFSENAFEDSQSADDGRELDSRTSQSCTPIPPPTPLEVLEEVDIKEDGSEPAGSLHEDEEAVGKEPKDKHMEVCDITIMRQSLTDDEKTQICEAGKGTAMEVTVATAKPMRPFNSLINSDAVRIYRKYLVTNSPHYIEMPATILSNISLGLAGSSGTCSETIFNEAQNHLLEMLEQTYLNPFLESSFYCKYTLEVLTSDNLTLRDILASEMALFFFMEHLEQQGKRHYLEFYVGAVHFKRSVEDQIQAQKDAVVLYEKYFSLQATSTLGLSDKIRFLLEEHICSPDPIIVAECFELPVRIIEHFLEQRYFAGFIKSPLYCRFISELLGKVKTSANDAGRGTERLPNAGGAGRRGHRKTLSDVTSDCSAGGGGGGRRGNTVSFISSQNTLLAMSDTNYQRNRKHLVAVALAAASNGPTGGGTGGGGSVAGGGDIMQIDSRQLYNPDMLWRRRSSPVAGLTFGRIDALGRYERDFDIAEPPSGDDRWSRNRIKKAVRKLVNLPEDKAQEELAWQVAEMIVKDITNVTMSNSSSNKT